MTGEEVHAARVDMGLSRKRLGDLLGYSGNRDQVFKTIKRIEAGKRNLAPDMAERLQRLYAYWVQHKELPSAEVIDGEA